MTLQQQINRLFEEQLCEWPLAAKNYSALSSAAVKTFKIEKSTFLVQFNPERITSSSAKVDAHTIRERKCFLCKAHLPHEQRGIPFKHHYMILVNPFPIFQRHLTIPDTQHVPQRIDSRFEDMLDLAKELDEYVVFYNGPQCGASAPDHFHFQAGLKGFLPIEKEWREVSKHMPGYKKSILWSSHDTPRTMLVMEATEKEAAKEMFDLMINAMETDGCDTEPMLNLLMWYEHPKWVTLLFPRVKHRPSCFYSDGEEALLISPAAIDMGGVCITPEKKDFDKVTAKDIHRILTEVCISPGTLRRLANNIEDKL